MIKPTVGRVVWFNPHPAELFAFSDQPLAALVTYVHSDTMVNVVVFDSNGGVHAKTSIRLQQDEPLDAKGGNFVAWMPYQKAVATGKQAANVHAGDIAATDAGNAANVSNGASDEAYLRRWAIETAMQASRDNVPAARDVMAYAEKLRSWVSGAPSAL